MWGSIIGAITGAGGSLLGSLGKQDEIDNKQHGIAELNKRNVAWYNRRYNEDPTQRVDAQRILSMTEDALRRRNKAAEGRKAVMGGTEESVASEKETSSKAIADVTAQIAASNERRKDQIEQQYLKRRNELDDKYFDLEGERPSAYDIAGGMLAGAANGMQMGGGFGGK